MDSIPLHIWNVLGLNSSLWTNATWSKARTASFHILSKFSVYSLSYWHHYEIDAGRVYLYLARAWLKFQLLLANVKFSITHVFRKIETHMITSLLDSP
jgi:hypothetical protein